MEKKLLKILQSFGAQNVQNISGDVLIQVDILEDNMIGYLFYDNTFKKDRWLKLSLKLFEYEWRINMSDYITPLNKDIEVLKEIKQDMADEDKLHVESYDYGYFQCMKDHNIPFNSIALEKYENMKKKYLTISPYEKV